MRLLIALFFFGSFSIANAQVKQDIYFFKENGLPVDLKDSADYVRIVSKADSQSINYDIKEYYMSGKPKLLGFSSTNDPITLEGQCITYYNNGRKKEVLNYKSGKLINKQFYYFPNGKLEAELIYPKKPSDNTSLFYYLYTVNSYADSTGHQLVTNGNGYYKTGISECEVKNGVRHGIWKSTLGNDSIRLTENYVNGKLRSGTAIFFDGEKYSYTEPEIRPMFNGGPRALSGYINQQLRYPDNAKSRNLSGQILITLTFLVDVDGKVMDIQQLGTSIDESLTNETIRIIKTSSRWTPGKKFGRITKMRTTISVPFDLSTL